MGFASDTETYQLLGSIEAQDTEGLLTQTAPMVVIGGQINEAQILLTNAHRGWTNARRAWLVSWAAWGVGGSGSQTIVAEEAGGTAVEVARPLLYVSQGRTAYVVLVDSEDADVEIELYNETTTTTEDTYSVAAAGGREASTGTLTRTGLDSDEYSIIIKISNAFAPTGTGQLYSVHVIESYTAT